MNWWAPWPRCCNSGNQPIESIDGNEDAVAFQAAAGEPTVNGKSKNDLFAKVVGRTELLPLNQRTALLLNLKDAHGAGCIVCSRNGIATCANWRRA